MKIKWVILSILVLAMCIMAPISATDYSAYEDQCEKLLSSNGYSNGIVAPEVTISPYQVTVNYIGVSSTTEDIMKDVGSILGAYLGIVRYIPEVGNLLITIQDINENPIGTFSCQKEWVSGLDINDQSEAQRLALKVMLTAKLVQDNTQYSRSNSQYNQPNPYAGNWLDDRSG